MASKFNGTTVTIGASGQTPLINVTHTADASESPASGAGDAAAKVEVGILDADLTITVLGTTAVDVGDDDTITVTWADTTTDVLTDGVVTSVTMSGDMDGEVTSAIKFRPTAAA